MSFRKRGSLFASLSFALLCCLPQATAESPDVSAAEAERLYARASDYVENISESGYSYAYIQFYWKRAQSNIDRVLRVYPQTPTGLRLQQEGAKVGPFELAYFKERVLPRLETKRVAAFDAVNCAIFLYNLDPKRWDENRRAALSGILEVLSRQQRWNEALSFPVLEQDRELLYTTIFRVAARFQQEKLVQQLIENAPEDLPEKLWPILGEAMALSGESREEITSFLEEHPEAVNKLAVLSGMILREIEIRRAELRRAETGKGIQTIHYSIQNLDVRDDIEAVAKSLFPQPTPASTALVAVYRSALGERPAAEAPIDQHRAYLEHLAATQGYDRMDRYPGTVSGKVREACELILIELNAAEGRTEQAENLRRTVSAERPRQADQAALSLFRGRMVSRENPLTVRERTFTELPISDPLVLARGVMEWSLTPNRAIRGPSPYDSVVQKYLPGFENLPLPESEEVGEASSTSKPF